MEGSQPKEYCGLDCIEMENLQPEAHRKMPRSRSPSPIHVPEAEFAETLRVLGPSEYRRDFWHNREARALWNRKFKEDALPGFAEAEGGDQWHYLQAKAREAEITGHTSWLFPLSGNAG